MQQTNRGMEDPADKPRVDEDMAWSQLQWDIPLSVALPIEVLSADQPFPFLNTTLADLGIQESAVKERVVWMDTKRTQVKNKAGKLKEKEVIILEVRVKAQNPGDKQTQEVLYSTESHTDRAFCRTGVDILPWIHKHSSITEGEGKENELQPFEMTKALEMESQQQNTEEAREV